MDRVIFKQLIKLNTLFWGGWIFLYAMNLQTQSKEMETYFLAVNRSFYLFCPLFFLSLLLWELCRRFSWKDHPPTRFCLLHVIFANVFTILWLASAIGIGYGLSGNNIDFFMIETTTLLTWLYPQGLLKYLFISSIYYAVLLFQERKKLENTETELRQALRDSEWKVLRGQLNPQFLLNNLNIISELIPSAPGSSRKMLSRLQQFLERVLTESPNQTVTLENELEVVYQYLDMEKIRLRNRFEYEENIDPSLLYYPMPTMMLQPLVENALKHGISDSESRGWIRLSVNKKGKNIVGVVENSITSSQAGKMYDTAALRNLQQRLALLYGKDVQFSAQPSPDEGVFRVKFHFPVNGET